MPEGVDAHGMVVLALGLVEEPVESIVGGLSLQHQAVPQGVYLLQA